MFLDKPFHPLGSLVCLPLVLRTFAETHNACDDAHQFGNATLEGSMRKHQVYERLREWLERRFVRLRKIVHRHAYSSALVTREVQNCAGDNDRCHDHAVALHKSFFQIGKLGHDCNGGCVD
jgi:hypothetical protein